MLTELQYCADYFAYERLKTRELKIGTVTFGAKNPIVVQTMTNTDTLDTQATVKQCIGIIDAGGELVRISIQGVAEAENLKNIKAELLARGYDTPLSADVQYSQKAAEVAAQYVEKVRINPGNYAERNIKNNYSHDEYLDALKSTSEKLQALIAVCEKHKTTIRIGVNHGSLSNRILSRYGNTAEGMVVSALEFIELFEDAKFYGLIISLKSSHVLTMVHANRLLASRMLQNERIYPIHLGVTEAGNDIEGRQKSISGISTLLADGIGDTIRVSLTEAPENEIPYAIKLREYFNQKDQRQSFERKKAWFNAYSHHKRISSNLKNIGGKNPAVVIMNAAQRNSCQVQKPMQNSDSVWPDFSYIGSDRPIFLPSDKLYIQDFSVWENEHKNCYPLLNKNEFIENKLPLNQLSFVELSFQELDSQEIIKVIKMRSELVLVLKAETEFPIAEWRKAFFRLHQTQIDNPVILHRKFSVDHNDDLLSEATNVFSSLLLDGFGDGIWMKVEGCIHSETIKYLSFGVLQSCRLRLTQTEYIACPSCGRTLFNIEDRLNEIRKKTKHLKHLKIAVMGCMVNGLGEMADADYGYVGSSTGKVNLYKGDELKLKNISEKDASEELVTLIQAEGDWVEG